MGSSERADPETGVSMSVLKAASTVEMLMDCMVNVWLRVRGSLRLGIFVVGLGG